MINRKLLTTLAVMLVALTTMSAQAGDYTVYGNLHLSLDALNNGDANELILSSNTSYFGLKGDQELNDNFTFLWQFETFLDLANFAETSSLANRETYMGLKGDWGKFLAGKKDTPFRVIGRKVDFFGDTLGDSRQTTFGWDRRLDKVLFYSTPEYNGFNLSAAYQLKNDLDMADTGAMSASATYTAEQFYLGAAYELIQKNNYYSDDTFGWMPNWTSPVDPITGDTINQWTWTQLTEGNTSPEDATGLRFVGKYTGGDLAIGALFQMLQNRNGILYDDGSVVGDLESMTWGLGFKYAMSEKYAIKGQYYAMDPNTDVDDDDASMFAAGVDHMFDESLCFYGMFGIMNNGDFTAFSLGGGTHGSSRAPYAVGNPVDGTASDDPYGVSVGMMKKF